MPDIWNKKDERQYQHVKSSVRDRGVSRERAREIAARTVNKQRRKGGRTENKMTLGTGNPNKPYPERTNRELYNLAKKRGIKGRSKMNKAQLITALRA